MGIPSSVLGLLKELSVNASITLNTGGADVGLNVDW